MSTETMSPDELADYDAETVRLVEIKESECIEADANAESLKSQYTSAKKLAEHATSELRALIRERREGRGKRPELSLLDMVPKPSAWRGKAAEAIRGEISQAAFGLLPSNYTLGELWQQVTTFDPAEGTPLGLRLEDCFTIREAIQREIDREAGDLAEAAKPTELWRDYPIERWARFGLTPKDVEKLAAGESKTETGRFPIATVGNLADYSTPTATGWQRRLGDIKGLGPAAVDRLSGAEEQFWGWWRSGGEAEFAAERGLGNGNETPAGSGSEGVGELDASDASEAAEVP